MLFVEFLRFQQAPQNVVRTSDIAPHVCQSRNTRLLFRDHDLAALHMSLDHGEMAAQHVFVRHFWPT